ncbi:Pyridoxine/pyridoxamine 5'-phosphate oxidase [Frankia sp. AiPs1]|uniref:pyridoxamine 5'-phosphate oxidase n=1 Tax=Frankia sp. AiPa1 TaxID=573492 RepID=UPI00202AC509|nr:pyridoxamine 5'-phosphate oxidase [Frankia sp. AiPa1]MCL9760786.1 pyridoxamine 5'-phosphate oxidase [Frankia sp. AiPa1]
MSSSPHPDIGSPAGDSAPPNLAGLRRSYASDGLDVRQLAPTWTEQFARWFADAVGAARGDNPPSRPSAVAEANAAVLATASAAGRPSARTVLIKAFDHRGLVVYTNYGSRKARESAENPYGSLVLPWYALQRQVVVVGSIERVSRVETERYFTSRPRGSQLGAWASHQSEIIDSRARLDDRAARLAERWPVGTPVPTPSFWGGLRLVPETVEFWQGRSDRLHDRLRYRRTSDDPERWIIERLSP